MKYKTIEINWHDRNPVFSLDFHSSNKLATAGADTCVRVRIDW